MADHDNDTDSSHGKSKVVATITSLLSQVEATQGLSDFKIFCNGKEWPVHKAVLVMHSSVLEKACAVDLKEVDIGGLDLSVYTTRMVASLVHFLYKFEYATFDNGDQSQATDEHPGPLTFHAKMFLLGDHLKVEVLKSHAEKQLLKVLLRNTRTSEVDLARACAVAYGKRRAAKRLCVRLVSYLVGHDQPFNGSHRCAELEQAMRDHPDFAIDLARATKMMLHAMQYNPHEHAPAYRCPKCKKDFFAFIFEVHCPYKCYYRCGAEYTAAEWNREHKHDLKEYTNKELGIVEVGEGAWWLD